MRKRQIGKYEIIERLGRGGMAEVFRGYHPNLDRYVAIKVLHGFLADDPAFKARFEHEAQNIAKLKHPHIVQVYDFEYDTLTQSFYMVMELLEGPTLKDRLNYLAEINEVMDVTELVRVLREAANALGYAHRQGMLHRDMKPANLMLDSDERVVLTDFGIAQMVVGPQLPQMRSMIGTPAYMAPELVMGEAGDERADLYALGVMMYQIATGRLPFEGPTPLAIALKHTNAAVPSARNVNANLPVVVDEVIAKTMAKKAEERCQSAVEFIADLDRVMAEVR